MIERDNKVNNKFLNEVEFSWIEIIQKGESQKIEFKSTLRIDLKTNKPEKFIEHSVLKTLAAFLNSDGGSLIIGVEDNKNIIGLESDFNSFSKEDKLDEFQKHFDNLISTPWFESPRTVRYDKPCTINNCIISKKYPSKIYNFTLRNLI